MTSATLIPTPQRRKNFSDSLTQLSLAAGTRPESWRAMSANSNRRPCPRDEKQELLSAQGYVCMYCAEPFGTVVNKRGRCVVTSVHYDHAVPFAYLDSNPRWNWVASCCICNQIKGARMFNSIIEIRLFVLGARDRRRDSIVWRPPVSSEEDPEGWAIAFSALLADARTPEIDDWPEPEYRPRVRKPKRKAKGPWPWSK